MQYVDTYLQSADAAALATYCAALPAGWSVAPLRTVTTAAGDVTYALVRGAEGATLPALPKTITTETAGLAKAVVGVFAESPAGTVTALEWMDRVSPETQTRLYAAAQTNPTLARALGRLAAATAVRPRAPEIVATVTTLHDAGLLTDAERDALLWSPG